MKQRNPQPVNYIWLSSCNEFLILKELWILSLLQSNVRSLNWRTEAKEDWSNNKQNSLNECFILPFLKMSSQLLWANSIHLLPFCPSSSTHNITSPSAALSEMSRILIYIYIHCIYKGALPSGWFLKISHSSCILITKVVQYESETSNH